MIPANLIQDVTHDLHAAADPAFRDKVGALFNLKVQHVLGVRGATTRKIAATYWPQVKPLPMTDRLALCQQLIDTGHFECRIVAFDWASRSKRQFEPPHFTRFTAWLTDAVEDWNDCDDLSTHVLGEFFLKFPARAAETGGWARSDTRWVQRAAAVSLIPSVRRGQQLKQAFVVADLLLNSPDDLIQKAYGWLLKEACRHFQAEVFDFVMQRQERMPRTALRYAIEKMPPGMKQQAMGRVQPP